MNRVIAERFSDQTAAAGFLYRKDQAWLGAEDLRTITLTFVAAGLLMLVAATGLDCVLFSVVIEGAHNLDALASFRLASDLLPLALAFTALVTLVTGVAVIFARVQGTGETPPSPKPQLHTTIGSQAVGFA